MANQIEIPKWDGNEEMKPKQESVPPGIISFIDKYGLVIKLGESVQYTYDTWVRNHLIFGDSIHSIEV